VEGLGLKHMKEKTYTFRFVKKFADIY